MVKEINLGWAKNTIKTKRLAKKKLEEKKNFFFFVYLFGVFMLSEKSTALVVFEY